MSMCFNWFYICILNSVNSPKLELCFTQKQLTELHILPRRRPGDISTHSSYLYNTEFKITRQIVKISKVVVFFHTGRTSSVQFSPPSPAGRAPSALTGRHSHTTATGSASWALSLLLKHCSSSYDITVTVFLIASTVCLCSGSAGSGCDSLDFNGCDCL